MKIGIIAGNQYLPIFFCKNALKQDPSLNIIAVCFKGETLPEISKWANKTFWVKVGQIEKVVSFMEKENADGWVMVGQISPWRIFYRRDWDKTMQTIVNKISDFRPHSIFLEIINYCSQRGIKFIDSSMFLKSAMAQEGIINGRDIEENIWQDIVFGKNLLSRYVELDVGQTIVVKNKTAIALEGFDGTDKTIKRAYKLVGKGCVVCKGSKSNQDMRFDLPVVGMKTLKLLAKTKAKALALEAGRVIIIDKEEFIKKATSYKLALVGIKLR